MTDRMTTGAPDLDGLAGERLEALLLDTASVEDYLADFTRHAADHIGPGTHCSITLRHGGSDRRAASSDPRAARCDEAEVAAGAGPCITAMDERRVLTGVDVFGDTRWPEWSAAAAREGFRSAAAVPAEAGPRAVVALNLYSEEEDAWDDDRLRRAQVFAQQVARVVALCLRIAEQTVINEDLAAAMASRSTIDQAIGVVMAQNRCSPAEAFGVLRRASSHRNVKLRDLAASIVKGITGSEPATGEFRPRGA